jgi:hypothetical protein
MRPPFRARDQANDRTNTLWNSPRNAIRLARFWTEFGVDLRLGLQEEGTRAQDCCNRQQYIWLLRYCTGKNRTFAPSCRVISALLDAIALAHNFSGETARTRLYLLSQTPSLRLPLPFGELVVCRHCANWRDIANFPILQHPQALPWSLSWRPI